MFPVSDNKEDRLSKENHRLSKENHRLKSAVEELSILNNIAAAIASIKIPLIKHINESSLPKSDDITLTIIKRNKWEG